MNYKSYTASIQYSDEDECFVGRVVGIADIVGFHGSSVEEIRHAFHEAIDFYVATHPNPQKPMSGRFMLRLPPEIHAKAAHVAERSGKSLNQFVVDALQKVL